jgi:leucyl aminopeptidase
MKNYPKWLRAQPRAARNWISDLDFHPEPGAKIMVPDEATGQICLFLLPTDLSPWPWSDLAGSLPPRIFELAEPFGRKQLSKPALANAAALGWALNAYHFGRYKKQNKKPAQLIWPAAANKKYVSATLKATALVRDLINTPAGDLGPAALAAAAQRVGKAHRARVSVTTGRQLLDKNYPTIHAVGRAAADQPRLIDLKWGQADAPKITLVGKGVCFDTGGLDLKSAASMRNMKKDMGGGAHVLGLASMIMDMNLPVRLRVLVGAVENAVAGNAFRPGDIIKTKKGLTVEIGNTDAEGRLVLCDCLAEASREKPELIVDFATLTGAARVALGTDLPALFANDDTLAADILNAGTHTSDPLWRLPLHDEYRGQLKSQIADLNNISPGGFGGAITAALFLEAFVEAGTPWAHIDLMAWNQSTRPGRPEGGEAMGLRAIYTMLEKRYAKRKKR